MLVTYSKADPSFTHAVSSTNVSNLGGRVGAWVADIALLLFGLSAYLLVFGLGGVGRARLPRAAPDSASGADPLNDELPGWAHALGYVLLLAGAVGLESLRLATLGASLPGAPGGVIGGLIAQATQVAVGFTGATVVFLALIAIGLSLFLDFSWLAVAERLGRFIEGLSRRAERRREEEEDRAIGEAASKVARGGAGRRARADRGRAAGAHRAAAGRRQAVRAQAEGKAGAAVRRDWRTRGCRRWTCSTRRRPRPRRSPPRPSSSRRA